MSGGEKSQDMIMDLFFGQFCLWLFSALSLHKHRKDVIVFAGIVTTLCHQGVNQHIELAHGCHTLPIASERVIDADIQEVFSYTCRTCNHIIESATERTELIRQVDVEKTLADNS